MEQYIPKAAVVAEIERRIKGLQDCHADKYDGYAGEICGLKRLLSFIDILEVKEVDLKNDFGFYLGIYTDSGGSLNDYEVAKHFFELGLIAQKGE